MKWFKLHSEFSHDPKLATFSKSERCDLIDLLCLANESVNRGSIDLEIEDIAATLSLSIDEYEAFEAKLARKEIVRRDGDVLIICNWEKRQYQKPSDAPERVAKRVAKHREEKRNATCNADVTRSNALDTDTDTEIEPDVAVAPVREQPATPPEIETSETERRATSRIRQVRGLATVPDGEIVLHLRDVLSDRASPLPDDVFLAEAIRFRDYWQEKRKSQPEHQHWRGWKRAMTNWFTRTKHEPVAETSGLDRYEDWTGRYAESQK